MNESKQVLNYFITGGTGLLGSFMIEKLLSEGHKVKALVRPSTLEKLDKSKIPSNLEYVEGQLSDYDLLVDELRTSDNVIHAAGLVSYSDKLSTLLETNVQGTATIVNAALEAKVKRFCHISSIATLNESKDKITENSKWEYDENTSHYALSKYKAELEVWRGIAEGLSAFMVNPSVILGIGDTTRSSLKLIKHVQDQKPFYPIGTFNYVDVRDVIEMTYTLIQSDIVSERFILNAGKTSYKSFFESLATAMNKKAPKMGISPTVLEKLRILDGIRCRLLGGKRFITKPMINSLKKDNFYENQKAINFTNHKFRELSDTIDWIAATQV
ncbi:NAD-dependent epimerase/dehydratase family protein [Sediminitomix flava]|uniref:Nucleoside-diphosphate-sugar epimerase n=1 Tax=Sediminitomix flava TaxID=379075 RepID=A0A315Z1B0_SEDFL|nr:NAD-dependent epimerase/dehydratase family protein [Sediminitomix flava]PWJ36095.1 nucleoside-diphosphate-sugar epimerase [Sediminitomix flava]